MNTHVSERTVTLVGSLRAAVTANADAERRDAERQAKVRAAYAALGRPATLLDALRVTVEASGPAPELAPETEAERALAEAGATRCGLPHCGGRMCEWIGQDGHGSSETFHTCTRCRTTY